MFFSFNVVLAHLLVLLSGEEGKESHSEPALPPYPSHFPEGDIPSGPTPPRLAGRLFSRFAPVLSVSQTFEAPPLFNVCRA